MSIQNEQWPHASCGHCGADDCPGDCYAGLLARIAELEAGLAAADRLAEALKEINGWLVCYSIATPDDMAQSFEYMQRVTSEALTDYQSQTQPKETL